MMKKTFLAFLSILMVISLITFSSCGEGQQEKVKVIKIGAVLPLTGNFAYFGELNSKAIQMAIDDLKADGRNIEYFLEDNQSTVNKGITAAKLLIDTKSIDALITTPSPLCLAVNKLLEGKKIVHITLSAHPDVLATKANTIRAYLSADDDARELANFLISQNNIKKILVFVINDDYGLGLFKSFENVLKDKTVAKEYMNFGQNDFKNQLSTYNLNEQDGIVVLEYGSTLTSILLKQIRELNADIKIFGTSSLANSTIRNLDTKITNGIIFSSTPFDLKMYNDKAKKLVEKYKVKYDSFLNLGQSYAYDAVINYVEIFEESKINKDLSLKQLYAEKFNNSVGIIGKFSYKPDGDIISETKMAKYENGEIIPINQ